MNRDLEKKLRPLQLFFVAAAVVMIASLSIYAGLRRVQAARADTAALLLRAKEQLALMQQCVAELNDTATRLSSLVPAAAGGQTPEALVYARLDEIKSQLPRARVTVGAMEEKSGELRLPFTLKQVDGDYTAFVNGIGRIESLVLPDVSLRSVAIAQGEDQGRAGVILNVDGVVAIPRQR